MNIAKQIAEELKIKVWQVEAVMELIDEGCTIPFIARYRKEKHGSLNDEQLRNLDERLTYLRNLEERKETVLASIEEQGKLTEELKQQILAAQTQGASSLRIIFRHILPNILGQQVVSISSAIPGAIFLEAYLSFIGLGIKSPMTSWGQLCQMGASFYRLYPYQLFIPGVFISVTILAFYLFGNCLRDALDPHLRN